MYENFKKYEVSILCIILKFFTLSLKIQEICKEIFIKFMKNLHYNCNFSLIFNKFGENFFGVWGAPPPQTPTNAYF